MQSSAALLGLHFPAPARPPTTLVILAWHDISMAARSCLAVTGSVQCRLDNLFYETLSGVLKGELHAVAWLLGNRARASAVALQLLEKMFSNFGSVSYLMGSILLPVFA